MARYQPEHKAKTRQKLVESAVTAFRRNGIDSAGLKEIMRELGLTVGGFYRHFESKSELVQSALTLGFAQSIERMCQASGGQPGDQRATNDGQSIERFAAGYLSETHRRSIAQGCVLAALASHPRVILSVGLPQVLDAGVAQRFSNDVVSIAERVLQQTSVARVFAEGGATAAELVRRMGWARLEVVRELAPGVATLAVNGDTSFLLTIKPGSYTWPAKWT